MYHKNRILMTALTAICLAPLNAAWAYPPTLAGLQQLVRDDEKMLPAPFAASLAAEQHQWEADCKSNAHALPHCEQDLAAGQITYYQSKIFWSHGFLFGSLDWKATLPLNKAMLQRDYGPYGMVPGSYDVRLDQSIPQIAKPRSQTAIEVNAAIRAFIGPAPTDDPHSYENQDDSLDYAQSPNALPGIISIMILTSYYTHGAAHGEFGGTVFNWNVEKNRLLLTADIFATGSGWQDALAAIVFAKLARGDIVKPPGQPAFQPAFVLFPNVSAAEIRSIVVDSRNWVPGQTGLTISFPLYSIAPYIDGCPSVLVPWAKLAPYLAKGGLAPG